MSTTSSSGVITCRAAVAWRAGKPLMIEQVSPPKPMEIRVKVVSTTLCRSDITAWESHDFFPRIFDHEVSGIVESVGEGVTEFTEGDHVLTVFTGECTSCKQCKSGRGAAWNVAYISKGSTVVIFGLGTVGLSIAQGARHRGASRIIGMDNNPEKHEIAKAFGITEFVNPSSYNEPIQQVIKRMTDGGADYSFECVGNTEIVTAALHCTHVGWGSTVTLGVPKLKPEVSAHYGLFLFGRTLKGILFGGWKPKSDLPSLVDMYQRKVMFNKLSACLLTMASFYMIAHLQLDSHSFSGV